MRVIFSNDDLRYARGVIKSRVAGERARGGASCCIALRAPRTRRVMPKVIRRDEM